jgi:hypothetical protein
MHSYMNLIVLSLAVFTVCPALSAPIQYRYGNLLELEDQAFLIREFLRG